MSLDLSLTVTGLDEATSGIAALEQTMGDMTPAMRAVGEEIERFAHARFLTRTSPTGEAWAPTKKPSANKGVMEDSIYVDARSDGLSYGARAEWSDEQQNGTSRMPARPFLPTSEDTTGPAAELWQRVERIISRYAALNAPVVESGVDEGFGDFSF